MSKYKIQSEAIIISIYCNITLDILKSHERLRINKLLLFSYLIKRNKRFLYEIYDVKHSKDILLKCISYLSGNFEGYCKEIKYIVKAINILIRNNNLRIENYYLNFVSGPPKKIYTISKFMDKVINESKLTTDSF
ncbi:hypothetical protein [Clostridioides difficile]|uniref:hypothetical protein n=1 Tax=Clostridioides difficile TaxID=1496 RepID=UPI000F610980|nr:hypothetical protein [Clostridioides difficile]MCJ0310945.1 hypothetical protein [Clostridioides difficile]MCJ0378223.1 hypothetical protein [Clostridioides difficile]MCJ0412139.1 hypothetical protein [Clostridioides difficile]MCO8701878.1 hypothetical protein [Clostridioides difficile]MCP8652489.1 hypothetical protein [Clostridioides difficile]